MGYMMKVDFASARHWFAWDATDQEEEREEQLYDWPRTLRLPLVSIVDLISKNVLAARAIRVPRS